MSALLIALFTGIAFIIAYNTYGRWLGSKIFKLSADFVCPSYRLRDNVDYVPTQKSIVFGHHFTSIAGTGPIVGPAIAVMWGWLPALIWVILGSIFIGAVHDFGALVVSLRNNGQTVGDIAGRVMNRRVRLLFLFVLFLALTIVLAIFGLVIAAVFKQYPASIFPCLVQIPIAVVIGMILHRKGVNLLIPSLLALAVMYLTVIYGDDGLLGTFNQTLAGWSIFSWVVVLLLYSYVASVLPVWLLLQPRDFINSLQLISALGLIVLGLITAAFIGGTAPVPDAPNQPLNIVAPVSNLDPVGAPAIFPFLFITIACGAISGFHCLVSSGTSSKQLMHEPDARFVGYGGMLTEGFLATIVIIACVAGLGLGYSVSYKSSPLTTSNNLAIVQSQNLKVNQETGVLADLVGQNGQKLQLIDTTLTTTIPADQYVTNAASNGLYLDQQTGNLTAIGSAAFNTRYTSWTSAGALAAKVGAFVDGAANLLKAMGIPAVIATALMGVLVASFAGTTLDTACRLQRYVVQELAATFIRQPAADVVSSEKTEQPLFGLDSIRLSLNPATWLANKHGATIFAIAVAATIAALPSGNVEQSFFQHVSEHGISGIIPWLNSNAGKGGLLLWPLFGATNQLLGGLAFLVIAFYLWRRSKPVWFIILPMIFMLIMPVWAMVVQMFIGSEDFPAWIKQDNPNEFLIFIGFATIVLEIWMIIEAIMLWPAAKGILEQSPDQLPAAPSKGINC